MIDVDILGHIFEQSITDLERLRQNLTSGDPAALGGVGREIDVGPLSPSLSPSNGERVPFRAGEEAVAASSGGSHDSGAPSPEPGGIPAGTHRIGRRRKQEGAVYTPAFITRYLVEQALGGVLKARFDTLRHQHEAEAVGTARKTLADPSAHASGS